MYFDEDGNPLVPPWEEDTPLTESLEETARQTIINDLLRPKDYLKDFGILRHFACFCLTGASLVSTPLALLELFKVHAEVNFKEICADALGAKKIQKMGEKEVGKHLLRLHSMWSSDRTNETVKELLGDCCLNMSFARGHGLQGIFFVTDLKIRITETDVCSFLWALSFLQLETTDILHLHVAKALKCDYFATLDNGIVSNREMIEKAGGFKLLGSAQDVIAIMRKHKKIDHN